MAFMLLATVAGCGLETPEAAWKSAQSAFERRDFPTAEAAMARLGKLREPVPEDTMMLGQLAIARNDIDQALGLLAKVPDDSRMAAQARLEQGQLELRRNRARVAEGFFKDAIRLDPKIIGAHRELIYIYGMQLRRSDLAAQFGQLAELEPLDFQQVWLWCMTRGTAWEPKEIVDVMGRYLAADPEDRFARLSLADALRATSGFDEAEKTLEPLGNDDPDARVLRVKLALDRGDDPEAEKLLEGGPKDHLELALVRGRLAMARNDTKQAVEAFRNAIKADPNNRDALFGLAHSLQKMNDSEAKVYLERSSTMEKLGTLVQRASMPAMKGNPQLVRDLGAACEAAGRFPEARAWYSIAIRTDPLDSGSQQALFRLKDKTKPSS